MEMRKIKLEDTEIVYRLRKNNRSRSVRLSVDNRGINVSMPRSTSLRLVENFLRQKSTWLTEQLAQYKKRAVNSPFPSGHYSAYAQRTRKLVIDKLKNFNVHYQHTFHRVSIRNQSTRWGSCSKQGNLNFNYRLLFLEEALVDYVVVHELCHIKQMNHSAHFWKLVAQTVPDYAQRRKKLRELKLH